MAKTLLRNNSQSPITLPPPYTGIVAPGDAVVLDDPPSVVSEVIGIVPELISFLVVTQVPDAQPVDGHDRAAAAEGIASALASLSAPLDLNGQRIINVAAPTDPQDAATKAYVDAHGGGGGGTVTNVSSTNAYLTVANGTTTPQLTVHVGTGVTDVAAGTDTRFNAAPSTAGAVVYDTGSAYSKTAAGAVGEVLKVGAGGLPEWGADSTTPSGPAGGSLAGNYPNPTIAPGAIANAEVSASAAIATSKLSGLLTDIAGNGLSSAIASSTLPARTYYVAVNGSDLNDGSLSAPFATIQAAHDEAATAYTAGEMVQILVGPGNFVGNLNLTRYNTHIQGAGHRAEMFATRIVGSVLVNPSTATDKFGHQIGLAGCMVSNSSTAASVKATGSGLYALILNDCYLYSNNAASTAAALACDATNVSRPRIIANECILATELAGASIMQLDRGDVRMDATQIRHNSSVTSGAAGSGVVVLNDATLWLNGSLVETRTRDAAIAATGASAGVKLLLTNTGITAAYAGPENTTHGITVGNTTGVAALLYQVSFNVADVSAGVYAINNSGAAVVTYADVSFQYGTNSAIAPAVLATALPQTETHGAMVLPSLTASLPLKLDANKQVTASAVNLAGAEVTGTLPIGKGGTGIATSPTQGGVVYGGATTQAYSAAGTSGQPLLSGGTGAPTFGTLDLSVAGNITGTLPAGNQAAQSLAGDLSGTTAAATVIALQGRALAATAPTVGQLIAWSGSAWEPATVSTGGGGGGASGLAYYFNGNASGESPVYAAGDKQLSLAYDTGSQYNTGAVTAPALGTEALLVEFVTDVGEPGAITIAPGIWDFNFYLVSSVASGTQFRARLYKWDGTNPLVELSQSPSDFVIITSASLPEQYTATLYVEQATLASGDRLVVQVEICSVDATTGRTVTGYFNGNTPAHVHTSIGAPGGTGLVKVVDGVVQAPAALLFNADVDAAAAIAVSKLDGNAGVGGANKVLHGSATAGAAPTWSAVALGSDVSGQLPVGNGGTGLSSGTAGGVPYFSASNTMASSSALTANALMLGGGTAGPSTLASLGTSTQVLHGNATGAPTWSALSLTADVSGTLPIANGGTNGTAAPTAGEVAYGNGSSYAFTSGSTAGKLLKSNGISPPTWLDIVPYTAGGTGTDAVPTANQVPYGTGTALVYTSGGAVGEVLGIGVSGQPTWMSNGASPTGPATGDLSSNYPNPTVAKINGTTVNTAGGALTVGNVLKVTGVSTVDYGPLELGSANAVSGVLPAGNLPTTIVYTTGSYANPSWITSLAGSKVTGNITGNAANVTGTVTEGNGGTNQTTYAAGDMLYALAANTLARLAAGSVNNGKLLTVVAGLPAWQDRAAIPYDVAGAVAVQPPAAATVFYFKATRAFTLSATSGDHSFAANTGATSSAVFTVYRNADQIFEATFAAAGSSPQSATIGAVTNNSISVGDVITVVAPATQDATLADVYWTLTGSVA